MPIWLKKFWQFANGLVQGSAAWLALAVLVGGAAVALMSWVTGSVSILANYGWGLPVLVAIGIVLAVILILSVAAIAWRFFNPLTASPPAVVNAKNAETNPDIGRIERKMEVVEVSLEQQDKDMARLNQLHSELSHTFSSQFMDLQKKLNAIQIVVTALDEKVATQAQVVANGTRLLIRALRAREAMRETLKPNDQIAMSLGKQLMNPEAYSSDQSWLADYHTWNQALRSIDQLMLTWTKAESSSYGSLFDLKGHHYERAPMPPANIKSDDTIIPFKIVCQVQSTYANQRDGLFAFLHEKSVYPG